MGVPDVQTAVIFTVYLMSMSNKKNIIDADVDDILLLPRCGELGREAAL